MFGKKDLVDDLSHDLDRARARRDTLASDVTTLTAEIAQLEARLSEEKDRRERARVAAEIEAVAQRLADAASTFAPAAARLCGAAEAARAIVARAGELSGLLDAFADGIGSELDSLMSELHRRAESARTGETAARLPPPGPTLTPLQADRMALHVPAFLRRSEMPDIAAADDQRGSAA
jgi:chromosome segregation ATPase